MDLDVPPTNTVIKRREIKTDSIKLFTPIINQFYLEFYGFKLDISLDIFSLFDILVLANGSGR